MKLNFKTHVSDETDMSMAVRKKKTHSEYSELMNRLQDIPTLPMVAMQVNQLINNPNSTSADIAEVMKKDQVLTAKVLRLVNSAYYAIPGGVTDVQRALAYLGFNTIAQLVLSLSVFSSFSKDQASEFSMLEFWRHALGTAVCSEALAKRLKFAKPEEAFSCGLLHDIGKLALHQIDRDRLLELVRETSRSRRSFVEVEREMEIPAHSYLGEMIATKWGLPQVIRLSIRYHHFDVSKMESVLAAAKPYIYVVRLANQICVQRKIGHSGDCSEGKLEPDMLKNLGMSETDLPDLYQKLDQGMEQAGAFLNV